MISVPLSFFVTLLLLILLVRLLRREEESGASARLFIGMVALYALQTFFVGLRWGYGIVAVLPVLSLLASAIPPLSYVAFRALTEEQGTPTVRDWPHALPPVVLAILLLVWRDPIDLVIIADFLGYGLALFWLGRLGPDGLVASRLDGVLRSYRSLQATALVLIVSAGTDIAVSLDMYLGGGRHAGEVISATTTVILLLLGMAAAMAGSESSPSEGSQEESVAPLVQPDPAAAVSGEDTAVAEALDRMMREKQLYADAELNLARLARRMGLPARTVSQSVNRVHGISVSQYVNNHRIAEACRLLAQTDAPVTRIVFDAGFMTKSNFNREFLRVTGLSPSAWRSGAGRAASAAP